MYDKIEDIGISARLQPEPRRQAIEAEKLTGDNIYKVLIYFDQLYGEMDDQRESGS